MSLSIHDHKSRIVPMDEVQGTTPKLSSETSINGKDLTTPCQDKREQKRRSALALDSRPEQVLPISTNTSSCLLINTKVFPVHFIYLG